MVRKSTIAVLMLAYGAAACGAQDNTGLDANEAAEHGEDTLTSPEPAQCLETPQGQVDFATDEGAHDENIEWWYWTGHLQAQDGRWFGFEQVFFLIKAGPTRFSMAHHAITDIAGQNFDYDVQFGMWTPVALEQGFNLAMGPLTARGFGGVDILHGELEGSALDLELRATKAPVLQHGDGYHDYPFGGNTWYYSRERMQADGTLLINGEELPVSGTAWFDHQWGALGNAANAGWDWFAIQLDDNREIMVTVVHDATGPLMYAGSYTDAECNTTDLQAEDIEINALAEWQSPQTGCTYPMGWDLRVGDLNFTVTPVLENQELVSREKTYWEGAATVSGEASGRAYIELVGYCP